MTPETAGQPPAANPERIPMKIDLPVLFFKAMMWLMIITYASAFVIERVAQRCLNNHEACVTMAGGKP